MPEDKHDTTVPTDVAEALVQEKKGISLVWIVPILAVVIGGWLIFKAVTEKGPTIQITFETADGLEAGKTKIKYKDVEVGKVVQIELSPDLTHVILHAELVKGSEDCLTDQAQFWVVKARVAAGEVSGLGTLLSGAYIGLEPGRAGAPCRHYVGMEVPPVVTKDQPGSHYTLNTDSLGSIDVGTPVYFHKIEVGKVVSYALKEDGKSLDMEIFIKDPHHKRVSENTRFWNASGLDVSIDANGINVKTESLVSILVGGIAFDVPKGKEPGLPAKDGTLFHLYPDVDAISEKTYTERAPYLICFDSSVRGLSVGAPVEFRGIQIGEVVDVKLEYVIEEENFRIPVTIETEPERIAVIGDELDDMDRRKTMALFVEKGLRAQLKVGSMLTGKLYVDLDFHPEEPPAELVYEDGFFCIPSVPATLEEITTKAMALLEKLENLPIEQIGNDLAKTVDSVEKLVSSPKVGEARDSMLQTLENIQKLTENMNKNTGPEVVATLNQIQATLVSFQAVVSNDSVLMVEVKQALNEMAGAARSFRTLADYLERHPEALIKGKGNE